MEAGVGELTCGELKRIIEEGIRRRKPNLWMRDWLEDEKNIRNYECQIFSVGPSEASEQVSHLVSRTEPQSVHTQQDPEDKDTRI
jgi:hypothetical protein